MRSVQSLGLSLFAAVSMLTATTAIADHGGGGPYVSVSYEARQLNNVTQWSSLRPNVKQTVSRFAYTANELGNCDFDEPGRHLLVLANSVEPNDHTGDPRCQGLMNQLHWQWHQVEHFLYDTNYDYPQVYQAYIRTRDALNNAGM